ncbi:hypothetical protein BJ165DRAFT_1529594 [Panaeolus papilionaceus]|nr:hypothetical protein BJ165DRAFT_1529594 [Panaeolus papilionaceus]
MTELSIDWADLDLNTSVFLEGNGEVSIVCTDVELHHDNMDVDIEEDDCGCGENQLSHYDFDGSVLANLPEKCRRYVNGPIGAGAVCTVSAVNRLTDLTAEPKYDDPNLTESESEINSSMQVEVDNDSEEALPPPPPNQQVNIVADNKTPRERQLIQRVDDWAKKVAKVSNSRKSSMKRKIHMKILGNSQQVNVKVSEK